MDGALSLRPHEDFRDKSGVIRALLWKTSVLVSVKCHLSAVLGCTVICRPSMSTSGSSDFEKDHKHITPKYKPNVKKYLISKRACRAPHTYLGGSYTNSTGQHKKSHLHTQEILEGFYLSTVGWHRGCSSWGSKYVIPTTLTTRKLNGHTCVRRERGISRLSEGLCFSAMFPKQTGRRADCFADASPPCPGSWWSLQCTASTIYSNAIYTSNVSCWTDDTWLQLNLTQRKPSVDTLVSSPQF